MERRRLRSYRQHSRESRAIGEEMKNKNDNIIKAIYITVILSAIVAGFVIGAIIAETKRASAIYYEEMERYER